MADKFDWTPSRIQQAARLRHQGYTYHQIAEAMNVNVNQISGIVHRHRDLFGWGRGVARQSRKVVYAEYVDPVLDEFELRMFPGVRLLDNTGCCYPLTEGPGNHMFCGHDLYRGKYCQHHHHKCKGYQGLDYRYRESYDNNIVRVS